jgi:uncharacterized membrane protein
MNQEHHDSKESLSRHISFEETKELLEELKIQRVADTFWNRIITLLIASLGLTTALAWDDTLRELFNALTGGDQSLLDKFLYSIIITLIAVILTIIFARLVRNKK